MIKIEIKNIDKFKNFMQKKQEKLKHLLPLGIRDATLYLHGMIKTSIARGSNAAVAVDTGRFLNSVDFEATGTNEAKVFSDLEYAKFIEFGTSKMKPRPHFRNTAFKEQNKMREEFAAEIKKI